MDIEKIENKIYKPIIFSLCVLNLILCIILFAKAFFIPIIKEHKLIKNNANNKNMPLYRII